MRLHVSEVPDHRVENAVGEVVAEKEEEGDGGMVDEAEGDEHGDAQSDENVICFCFFAFKRLELEGGDHEESEDDGEDAEGVCFEGVERGESDVYGGHDDAGNASGAAWCGHAFKEGLYAFIWGFDVEAGESEDGTGGEKEGGNDTEPTAVRESESVEEDSRRDAEARGVGEAVEFHAKFGGGVCSACDFSIERIEDDTEDDGQSRVKDQIEAGLSHECLSLEAPRHGDEGAEDGAERDQTW